MLRTETESAPITQESLLESFPFALSVILRAYLRYLNPPNPEPQTQISLDALQRDLAERSQLVLMDHLHQFDPFLISYGVCRYMGGPHGVLIPHAAFISLGVNDQGQPTLKTRLRSSVFNYVTGRLSVYNPTINFRPVLRELELKNPYLFPLVREQYRGANKRFHKDFKQVLNPDIRPKNHWAILMAPMAGISKPHLPLLHPLVHRLLACTAQDLGKLSYYILAAYPESVLGRRQTGFNPLLFPHSLYASGPHVLPDVDYSHALQNVRSNILALRGRADMLDVPYELWDSSI